MDEHHPGKVLLTIQQVRSEDAPYQLLVSRSIQFPVREAVAPNAEDVFAVVYDAGRPNIHTVVRVARNVADTIHDHLDREDVPAALEVLLKIFESK